MNQYDKSLLISEWLNTQTTDSDAITPLQSIVKLEWNTVLVYSAPDGGSAWSIESLVSLREFEKSVKDLSYWKNLCLARPVGVVTKDKVQCEERSFLSPLDLFEDTSKLETMTQEEINNVLIAASSNPEKWKQMKTLFDKKVNP